MMMNQPAGVSGEAGEGKKLTGYPALDQPWLKYYESQPTDTPLPDCKYIDYIHQRNQDRQDCDALDYLGRRITYGQMFDHVRETAAGLAALGVKAGDIVTVFSINTPETLYCIFALNLLNAAPCIEYVTESESEAKAAVEKCRSRIVIVLDVLLKKFQFLGDMPSVEHVIVLPLSGSLPVLKKILFSLKAKPVDCRKKLLYSELLRRGKQDQFIEPPFQKETPAIITHSGGTTGVPKGIILTNENINYVVWAFLIGGSDTEPGDLLYTCIPVFHAFGFTCGTVMPLILQQTMVLAVKYDEQSFIETFKKVKPNHTMSSSTYLPALIADPSVEDMDLSFYKTMGMGGTPLPHAVEIELGEFMKAHGSIAMPSLGYGMSELTSAASTELNRYYGKVGSVGIPLYGVNIRVRDHDTGKEKKIGEIGELLIATPGLMREYFQNEEETKATIETDEQGTRWIITGDLGYVDEDGFLFITGKLKRIYTCRSNEKGQIFHIFPDYIADMVCNVKSVTNCAVVCIPHPVMKNIPIAYVTSDEKDESRIREEVLTYCREVLPDQSVPKAVYLIDGIPKNAVGKPDYQALEKDAARRAAGKSE